MKITLPTIAPSQRNWFFRIALLLISISGFVRGNAQTGQWTWVSGDNTTNIPGVYGTKGTAAAANKPGDRDSQSGWKDASGNFWIFGGWDINSKTYNDLWMYDVSTGQWTWVSGNNGTINNNGVYGTKGTAAAGNQPCARYGQTAWVDALGNFWIFGGKGYDNSGTLGYLNDLWKYDPAANQWTWVSGDNSWNNTGVYGTKGTGAAGNKPGSRNYQASWMDAGGNLWIFGGYGYDATGKLGDLNDLWKYNPTLNQWTWISGDNARNMTGVYGTKGTAAATNKPGNRDSHSGWVDASGNFWIFGGWDFKSNAYNDLWKYDVSTGQWTWVSGDNTQNNRGVYGTKSTPAAANKPGSRYGQSAVVDGGGSFWIFGGSGYDASGNNGVLNDLWKYSPSTGQWTWTSGDNARNMTGVYGTKGTGAAANKPGGRDFQSAWIDASNNLWVFAGYDNNGGNFNDLWKFTSLVTLPVQQVSLEGVNHSNENILSWQTVGELNTVRYEVERSANGRNFVAIGSVAAKGSGDNRYSFRDYQLTEGNLYYRLRMEDINGAFYYSGIIVLSSTQSSKFSVFPNPAKNNVTLQIGDNSLLNTAVRLYDASGRLISELLINNGQQQIDLSHVNSGICLLQLANGKTVKILKQ